MELTRKPIVLYHASIERMTAAFRSLDEKNADYVLAIYLAGLSVECLLQAIAMLHGAEHDARHSLSRWLRKCPVSLQEAIRTTAGREWNSLVALWNNELRYLSQNGLLGCLRKNGSTRGIAGGPSAMMRKIAKNVVSSAHLIQEEGLAQWVSFTRK